METGPLRPREAHSGARTLEREDTISIQHKKIEAALLKLSAAEEVAGAAAEVVVVAGEIQTPAIKRLPIQNQEGIRL